ncbi:hypothetical protein WK55_21990 [Burkholderia ubonensis]|uniref:hypothetical protein n=1 Tax=Burkholderia ubonensis TaxID=101571 RepID=UPI0007581CD7|nr:hypothetical protein [Burkholderia ubonensis]KVT54008.1 hypothetical protein WK55_21990 [Burkholderia ubonensis]
MRNALTEYFEALQRLMDDCPRIVPKGTKITNDAVSLEAGRGKGSIKKSRPLFAELIEAIDDAAAEQSDPQVEMKARLKAAKSEIAKYRSLWEEALAREVSLLSELYEVRRALANLTGDRVLPLRSMPSPK